MLKFIRNKILFFVFLSFCLALNVFAVENATEDTKGSIYAISEQNKEDSSNVNSDSSMQDLYSDKTSTQKDKKNSDRQLFKDKTSEKLLNNDEFAKPSTTKKRSMTVDMVTFYIGAFGVIALIIVLCLWLKKFKLALNSKFRDFEILRVLSVGTKERVVLLQAGEEQIIVGVTSQSVNLICKLDKPLSNSSNTKKNINTKDDTNQTDNENLNSNAFKETFEDSINQTAPKE